MSEEPRVAFGFEDPFLPPVADRRADRRLRGRLVAPVTVWTAGAPPDRAGLTVSSALVAEGEPPEILGLLDPLSDLRRLLGDGGGFVVHVLREGDRRLAAAFAGRYPADPYEGLEVTDTPYGPVIAGPGTVISCRFNGARSVGYGELVTGSIEAIELGPGESPLAYYRGRFRALGADARPHEA